MAALTAVVIAVAVLAAHLADITREKSRKPHPVVPPRPVATTKQVLATPDDVRRVADALVALAQEATVANGQTGPEHDHLVQRHQARLMSLLHEQRLVAQRIQGHRDLTQLAEEVGRHAALYIVSTERLPMVPSASELTAAMAAAKQLDEAVGATPPTASAN
jgi:HEAT repeat protein